LELEQGHSPQVQSARALGRWEVQASLPRAQSLLERERKCWREDAQPLAPQAGSLQEPLRGPPVLAQRARPVLAPQPLPCLLRVPSREPQASALLPQAPQEQQARPQEQQPGACEPPSPPRPWRPYPLWLWPLRLLPRLLLPGYVSAPSRRHPREWSSSASFFP
jgi:hypothetical protein